MTALPAYGGIRLPSEIGAVVLGEPTTSQTPDSGHRSPVRAVVPSGTRLRVVTGFVLSWAKKRPTRTGGTPSTPLALALEAYTGRGIASGPDEAQADPIGLGFARRMT